MGRDGAGPSTGQQPLPGFLTAPLFEAGFLDIQEMGDNHSQQRRGNCLNVSLHLTSWPWDWRWEPGQGSLTLHLAGPLSPHPVSALRSLLSANQFQTPPALTSGPSYPGSIHKAPVITFSLRVVTWGFAGWTVPSSLHAQWPDRTAQVNSGCQAWPLTGSPSMQGRIHQPGLFWVSSRG